ncbi:efflux RND transporter permease subunit [Photobacterium swingsii]|nr:MMPL family transporter [Photobacterium swingsii]
MKVNFLKWPIEHPKWVLVSVLLAVILTTLGMKNLHFRGDYAIFFDGANPQLQAFNEIEATFNKTDNLSIVIAPQSGAIFTYRHLSLIQQLTDAAWQIPFSSRVDSIANYQHTSAVDDDMLVEDLLFADHPLTPTRIAAVKAIAINEPRLRNSLISENGDVAVVNITMQLPAGDKTENIAVISEYTENLLMEYRAHYPEVDFHTAGVIALNSSFTQAAQQDSSTLVPLMFLVILVVLSVLIRSVVGVLATLIVIVATITATLGFAGWIGMFLSVATANVPTLVMTLAVADCVHVIATFRQTLQQQGVSKLDAVIHSMKLNYKALLVTSVTTSIGFLMMNASDSPVLRDMGNLAAVGVMVAFVLSITLLPALLVLLPAKVKQVSEPQPSRILQGLADFVIHRYKIILPSFAVIALGAGVLIGQNKINDDSVKYFDTSNAFRQAADFMEQTISGMTTISIAIKTNQSQGISDPQLINVLGDFTLWLREQPETDHVASLSDTYRRLNMNMHGDDADYYRLPQDPELAAQYLLLYEMSLPYGLDLNNEVNIDKSSVKVQLTIDNLGSQELVELEQRIYNWFSQHAPQYDVVASSPSLMFAHIGEVNMDSMLKSLPISLLLISGLLIFALRSLRLGMISLLPNLIPAILGFGCWALISGEINLGLSVVISLTLGIVVDDTVHFLSKYQYARHQGQTAEQAIRYAFNTVGRALAITTLVLVAGFMVLASSSFRLNADMGQLSAIIIIFALVVDFLLLPAALLWLDRRELSPSTQAAPAVITS